MLGRVLVLVLDAGAEVLVQVLVLARWCGAGSAQPPKIRAPISRIAKTTGKNLFIVIPSLTM